MRSYIVVQRFSNVGHVYFPTSIGSVITVSVYGFGAHLFSDEKLIYLAKEELRRKTDSEIFCLVSITPRGDGQLDLDFTPAPCHISTH
jgi:hypothetical protein